VTGATGAALNATYTRTEFTATSGQTIFTATYQVGFVEVYLNGVFLSEGDYTATNGTTVVLGSAAVAGDIVEVIAFNTVNIGTASTTVNIAGGAASYIPYQVSPGATDFILNGVTGQALISNGTSAPSFGTLGVTGGGTGLTAPGTNGNVLTSNGTIWTSSAPAAQAYPGAGIPNSTGSAWGTSYTTSGSGTVVALTTSPTLVTPVLGTPTSGNLSNCTADGTNQVGFRNIPQVSQSAAYTLVLADSGDHIFHPSADTTARTWTIPANSSVAFPIGTAVTFINQNGAGVITIAITTDTMRLAGAGTTGSRTLAANGIATAIKITSTEWIISGTGLT
jgi:hypothetical protein